MNRLLYPLIEPAIDKVLRDLRTDPRRGALNLVDTGLKFSQNPGRRAFLSSLREALQQPGCAYPGLLGRIANETDPRAFKTIARNLLKGTFGDGADQIAKLEQAWDRPLPRCIAFDLRRSGAGLPPLSRLDEIVRQGKTLGVYAYLLLTGEGGYTPSGLQKLLSRHQDCIFLLVASPAAFQPDQIRLLAGMPHLLCCLSLETAGAEAVSTAAALLGENRMLYGGLLPWAQSAALPPTMSFCATLGFSFAVLLEEEDVPHGAGAEIQQQVDAARTAGSYPLIPFYLPHDPAHSAILQLDHHRDRDFYTGANGLTLGQYLRSLPR